MKRKPDKVHVFRLELQSKERELFESYMMMEQGNKLIRTLSQISIVEIYAWLNLLEVAGIIETPVPTVDDADQIPAAIHAWTSEVQIDPTTGEKKTILLQDRILNFLSPLVDPKAWGIGRD